MAVDMDQVRAALEPEEPNYPRAAQQLGTDALPHLEKLVTGDHTGLAAKAAYLAGLIGTEKSLPTLEKAARNANNVVRIAAAAAVRHLPEEHSEPLLLQLVDDADAGVRKVAVNSAPAVMSNALRARVAAQRVDVAELAARSALTSRAAAKKGRTKKAAAKKPAAKKPAAKKPATKKAAPAAASRKAAAKRPRTKGSKARKAAPRRRKP